MVHTCNPSTWEIEVGRSEIQEFPQLPRKFEASLGSVCAWACECVCASVCLSVCLTYINKFKIFLSYIGSLRPGWCVCGEGYVYVCPYLIHVHTHRENPYNTCFSNMYTLYMWTLVFPPSFIENRFLAWHRGTCHLTEAGGSLWVLGQPSSLIYRGNSRTARKPCLKNQQKRTIDSFSHMIFPDYGFPFLYS